MTTTELPLVVVDTCCFVSYLTNDKPERTAQVEYLLGEHRKTLEIVVPSVVELELFGKYPQVKSSGNQTNRARLLRHAERWFVGQSYLLAELDRTIVDRGIELMREFSIHGIDASILATALLHGATHVYTYDTKMLAVQGRIDGLMIEKPAGTPNVVLELPPSYQGRRISRSQSGTSNTCEAKVRWCLSPR